MKTLATGMHVLARPTHPATRARYPQVAGDLQLREGSIGNASWPVYAVEVMDSTGYVSEVVVDPDSIVETTQETTVVEFHV